MNEEEEEVSVFEMKVDNAELPLEEITNYGSYQDFKLCEKPEKIKLDDTNHDSKVKVDESKGCKLYKPDVKGYLIYEKARATKYGSKLKEEKSMKQVMMISKKKKTGSGKPVDIPLILKDERNEFLVYSC